MIIFNDKLYDILKFISTVLLPNLSVLYATIGDVINLPYTKEIPLIITAIGVFIKHTIDFSSAGYYKVKSNADVVESKIEEQG